MTSPSETLPVSDPQVSAAPLAANPAHDSVGLDLHQEINERRARVENSELLQHLRGL